MLPHFVLCTVLLISSVLATDSTSNSCSAKLPAGDHTADIYINTLHWKEPKTSSAGGSLQLECQNGFLNNELKDSTEKFTCSGGLYNGTYKYPDLLCRSDFHRNVVVNKIQGKMMKSAVLHCDNQAWSVYEVSRKLPTGGEKLLYRACLDQNTMRPKYTMRVPSSEKPQIRPQSREEDVWGFDGYGKNSQERQKLSTGYVKRSQQRRFTDAYSDKYNRGKQYPHYFNRGHLVAYRDFNDHEDQKATVEYINAAPQWEVLNEHSWSAVEITARSMLQNNPENWEIYTGTYGVIQSPRGQLFAAAEFDKNGRFAKGLLPVPLVFWKLVHNTKDSTKSRAFIGVNNPELRSAAEVGPTYRLCQHPILKDGNILQGDASKGFTYECPVDEFLTKLHSVEKIVKAKNVPGA